VLPVPELAVRLIGIENIAQRLRWWHAVVGTFLERYPLHLVLNIAASLCASCASSSWC
jgi:hypothetical protein